MSVRSERMSVVERMSMASLKRMSMTLPEGQRASDCSDADDLIDKPTTVAKIRH